MDMSKKILLTSLIFFGLVVVVFFARCTRDSDVSLVSFYANSGALGPEYYWESNMDIVPDDGLHTLAVTYTKGNPFSEDTALEVDAEGFVGGEFFDRFEGLLGVLQVYESMAADPMVGAGLFTVTVERVNGDREVYEFNSAMASETFVVVNSFYEDVSELFTEDV